MCGGGYLVRIIPGPLLSASEQVQYERDEFERIIDVQIHIDPLDDEIRESMLARLPERQVIEQDLARAWADIPESEHVLKTKLHYLDKLIEVDLILPASMCSAQHQAGIERLKQGASTLDYIGRVNIYFVN